jgi:hypothetical protein
MFTKSKVSLDNGLYHQAKAHATSLGYVSLDEYVTHVLERELQKSAPTSDDAIVMDRLKGLGYIE